jgi:hypothetical protein
VSLQENLLREQIKCWVLPPDLQSSGNARGLYSPLQFVLRLRPDIHKELDSIESGIKSVGELKFSTVQAFSTYFHETIHWWQHVGSISGLMLSLIYPTQAHINNRYLKELLHDIGPVKPIIKYDSIKSMIGNLETKKNINRILNNWHDIEFFRRLSIDPKKASKIVNSPYFECLGHTYNMAWASIIWLLAASFDRDFDIFPDIRAWEKEFDILRQKKVEGYYFGSRIILPPIGAREIFEGQARFSQIQYLYFASGGVLKWSELESIGMLDGVYREAFDTFLKILGASWPTTPDHPLVGLFLLICDISINPTDGFPFNIYHFESFIISVDPGMRFLMLCQLIQNKYPNLKDSIQNYSKEEYVEVGEILCQGIICKSLYAASKKICAWASSHPGCLKLLEEDNAFKFSPENLPVRVFFARFLRFQIDKFKMPEYFCWPGVWSVGVRKGALKLEQAETLFENHSALFVDRADGIIYPRTFSDKNEHSVFETFNSFYMWNVVYDLTRQWIIQNGEFDFNFCWLTSKYSQSEMTEWASNHFEISYGVKPNFFKII